MRLSLAAVLIIVLASDVIGDFIAAFVIYRTKRRTRSSWDIQNYLGLLMFVLGVSAIVDAATLLTVYRYIPPQLMAARDVIRFVRTTVTWAFIFNFLGIIGPRRAGDSNTPHG